MSAIKQLIFDIWEGRDAGDGLDLSDYAAKLSGAVVGNEVHAPSPGLPANDRSLVVRFYSGDRFYIYAAACTEGRAYQHVREKLDLAAVGNGETVADRTAAALRIWGQTVPAQGTIVERYLRSRAITLPVPECLRFHSSLYHREYGGELPAMVAAMTDISGAVVAVHMTWLCRDGSGKADVRPMRKTRGPITGAAVRLAPVAEHLCIGEGVETSLSVTQATGRPAWAVGSTHGLKTVTLPAAVRGITLLGDGDPTGREACRVSASRLFSQGRNVRIAQAPDGKDFNDLLRERAAR